MSDEGLKRQVGLLAIKLDPKQDGADCPNLGIVGGEPHCNLLWDVCGLNFDDPAEDFCPRRAQEIRNYFLARIAELERDKKAVTMEIERVKRKAEEYDIDGYDQPRMAKYMAVKRVCVSLLAFIRKLKEVEDAKHEVDKQPPCKQERRRDE